ncbi:MAG: DUF4292 domain-containing protein [Paludibacteraceae bacterium]|nr:DUF4292 domain-containing protein [Paludibacteraceae bacterium]
MKKTLLLTFVFLLLAGCGVKQKAIQPKIEETQPLPKTVSCSQAKAAITLDGKTYTVKCSVEAVRDTLIVASIAMPLFGTEMARLEATPTQLTGIIKLNRQYAQEEWDEFKKAEALVFQESKDDINLKWEGHDITIHLEMPEAKFDQPIVARQQNISNYEKINIQRIINIATSLL